MRHDLVAAVGLVGLLAVGCVDDSKADDDSTGGTTGAGAAGGAGGNGGSAGMGSGGKGRLHPPRTWRSSWTRRWRRQLLVQPTAPWK